MTINQALDQLTNKENLNEAQNKLRESLVKFKVEFGGRTEIENSEAVKNLIQHGDKEGKK